MDKARLKEIQQNAKENKATLEEIVEITSESFLSQSNHFTKIKDIIMEILKKMVILEDSIYEINMRLEEMGSPVYQVEEDEVAEEE